MPRLSLWLEIPDLQPVVDELAAEVGNPTFLPHLTLVGSADADTDLAAVSAPAAVQLSSFGSKGDAKRFFCLVAEPDDGLPEWPHLSLVYGTDAARECWSDPMQLVERFGDRLFGRYDVTAVALWDTSGSVDQWRRVS